MIKVSIIDYLGEKHSHVLKPTIFPDGTSQVWKLPEIFYSVSDYPILVDWVFNDEAEFMHLAQLKDLLNRFDHNEVNLYLTYLPYGRQDKPCSNGQTFALRTFLKLLDSLNFNLISVIDPHNEKSSAWDLLKCDYRFIHEVSLNKLMKIAGGYDLIVYPDKGAVNKYYHTNGFNVLDLPMITFDKVRDESTGKITKLELNEKDSKYKTDANGLYETGISSVYELEVCNVLIVDDICDGGRTFIEIAKKLKDYWSGCNITLYTTYGLYTHEDGKNHLLNNGIDQVLCAYELNKK